MDERKVFLSSTFKDLAGYRDAIYRAIQRMDGWRCVRMEDFGARDWEADEFCRQKVAECDLFVGILGLLYGSVHKPSGLSYTEREYQTAVGISKPRLMFLTPDNFPVPGDLIEGSTKQRKQQTFRKRVSAERVRDADWTSPDQLSTRVVIAIRDWEQEQLPQEGQKRKQAQLEEIGQIETLVAQRKLEEAIQKLVEVTSKYGREPGLRDALTKVRKRVHLERSRHLKTCVDRVEALRQYLELQEEIEKEGWKDPELIATLAEAGAAIILQPLRWPGLWSDKAQRQVRPAITAWLSESGTDLRFDPFGPERAEEDYLLPQLFVEPPGWQRMKAPEPTIVFGAEGSGRTASFLLLSHTCTTTGFGLDRIGGQIDTFPVRLPLFPEGKSEEAAATCWKMLTRAVAQATLDFMALNPQTFAETHPRQQRALARLFAMHQHYLGDLSGYLEGAGLNRAIALHLAENIQRAAQGTQPPALTDEAELLAILAEARLFSFQQHYVLAEVPDVVSALHTPEEIVPHMRPLLQMMRPLATRKVYLKLFISANVRRLLGSLPPQIKEVELVDCGDGDGLVMPLESLPPQIKEVELSWDAPALHEMLEWRVQQAGAPSFRALFRHLPEVIDPATCLVEGALKAEGPPRRLIQLGQELLIEHIRRTPTEPKLRWEGLKTVLEK